MNDNGLDANGLNNIEDKNIEDKRKRRMTYFALAAVMASVFVLFAVFRQKYVGACDWYAYYQQSLLLREGKIYLDSDLDAKKFPSVSPLGFYPKENKTIPHFPPGFPLLLAIFGFVGLEFYVTPLIGALSFLIMFLIIKKFTGEGIAFMMALLWVLCPITMWGSTHIMSDLVAAFFLMLTFYFYINDKTSLAGLVYGFSLMVRPSNFVFGLVLLPLLIRDRKLIKFGLYCAIFGSVIAAYNWMVHGAPWKYGFYGMADMMNVSAIFPNIAYYGKEAFLQYTPLLLVPAGWALVRKWKKTYIYALWLGLFLVFYCLVILGTRNWWGTRFMLPAYPALFILAGIGIKDMVEWVKSRKQKLVPALKPVGAIFTVLLAGYFIYYVVSGTLVFRLWKGKEYYEWAKIVEEMVPPGSWVGSVENSGSVRLYANLNTFNLNHLNSYNVMKKMLRRGPVYIIYEPVMKDHRFFREKLPLFAFKTIAKLSGWRDYYLIKVRRRILRPSIRRKLEKFKYLDTIKGQKFKRWDHIF